MSSTVVDVTPDSIVGSVKWRQNIQVRPYEVAECTIEREFRIPPDADYEEELALTQDAIYRVRTYVEDALGIKDTERSIVELVQSSIPGTQVVSESPVNVEIPAGHSNPPDSVGAEPPHDPTQLAKPRRDMTEVEKAMDKENTKWAKARLSTHPDEFYDNTQSKTNPAAPDFRHKTYKIGVWVD